MALTVSDQDLGTPEVWWLNGGPLGDLARLSWRPPRRAVVVSPHPDDEVLGVGGLMAQLAAAGTDIEIVAVTDGEASHPNSTRIGPCQMAERRAKERALALDRVGVRPARVTRLGLADGQVSAHAARLADAIATRLGRGAGQRDGSGDGDGDGVVCLAPWRHDGHPDHDAAGQAAADACTMTGANLAEYLVWAWHWTTPSSGHIPWSSARRVDLPRLDAARKRRAIAAFTSQIRAIGPDAGDAAILPAAVLARFRRPFEVVLI